MHVCGFCIIRVILCLGALVDVHPDGLEVLREGGRGVLALRPVLPLDTIGSQDFTYIYI